MAIQHLFGRAGESALARTMAAGPLLAFDFDGTLTPIVAHPGDARLSQAVSARLAVLAAHLPVAIVTGRSVDDVRGRLGFEPQFIVGNHGAEDAGGAAFAADPGGALSRLRARLVDLRPRLQAAEVTVEDKGASIALHYRLARSHEQALRAIAELLSERDEALRVFGGKRVVNVVPASAPDKADAVRTLVQRSGASCAVFAGDDVNDEPVFAAAPPEWLTVRVGRGGAPSQARFYLDDPGETAAMLERMVAWVVQR